MIIAQTSSVTVGGAEFPKNTLYFESYPKGEVAIKRATDGGVVVAHQLYSEYVDNTGKPYASKDALITALRTAFFA